MAGYKSILFLAAYISVSVYSKLNECQEHQEISCESLRSPEGFTYRVSPNISCSGDSEEGWHFQNGTLIVDPNYSEKRLSIVTDVSSTSLTISVCTNLKWELMCIESQVKNCRVNYTVIDSTPPEDNVKVLPGWGIVLIVIGTVATAACVFTILFCCFRPGQGAQADVR